MTERDTPHAVTATPEAEVSRSAEAPTPARTGTWMNVAFAAGGVVILLVVVFAAVLASSTIGARNAEIARLQDDNTRLSADVASARRERDDLSAQLAAARGDVSRLESEVTQRQRRMLEAVAASEAALARAGRDPHAVLALDDQLLREATDYMRYTSAVENALRAGDLSAIPSALMQMQASRARWDALVAQRNQAVASFRD